MSVGHTPTKAAGWSNTCKLLIQSHIMSVKHKATEAVGQSIHPSY